MAVTRDQVVTALLPDEPRYDAAAQLGTEALPHLMELVRGEDPNLASKAASLATRIKDEESLRVLSQASEHPHVVVRIAAAAELYRLGSLGISDLVLRSLQDSDPQVRLVAVSSSVRAPSDPHIEKRLQVMKRRDPVPEVRDRAADALRRTNRIDRLRDVVRHGKSPRDESS
jgi:HEAT repeat protein